MSNPLRLREMQERNGIKPKKEKKDKKEKKEKRKHRDKDQDGERKKKKRKEREKEKGGKVDGAEDDEMWVEAPPPEVVQTLPSAPADTAMDTTEDTQGTDKAAGPQRGRKRAVDFM